MLKKDIVDYLYSHHGGFQKKECKQIVDTFFKLIEDGIKKDGKVLLRGFGKFYLVKYREREIFHPSTQEKITIKTHNTVHFKKLNGKKK